MKALAATLIAPEDLLDAARTMPLGDIATCDWLSDWVPATIFLDWARRGLPGGAGYGPCHALTGPEGATCCSTDPPSRYHQLFPFSRSRFPGKISAPRPPGPSIPDVVHAL